MCGIGGFLTKSPLPKSSALHVLNNINLKQKHRGPDGQGEWVNRDGKAGLAHTRLSIIDIASGAQPMVLESGNAITYNGEIYNFKELRQELGRNEFKTNSDTEVILRAYEKWGEDCVNKIRGMFAFAIWDDAKKKLFMARDRFGIKPFYYTVDKNTFCFASEIKAIIPFKKQIEISNPGLRDYFTFQFCLGEKTLFKDILQLKPAHCGYVDLNMNATIWKYWEVHYDLDWNHTETYFVEKVREALSDSINIHMRSDVEVGAYVSGGLDSSIVAALARQTNRDNRFQAFTGKFSFDSAYDESPYARALAQENNMVLHERDISAGDFVEHIGDVIYHLDQPVAGPGSFPQFMVSRLVRDHLKVVLGGQGGDEIFGGYTRYLIAYFEQCIKGAIDGTSAGGKYIVSYESIIPNLTSLRIYKPLIQEFWSSGIFDERDKRYFRLINRANTLDSAINWKLFNGTSSFDDFKEIYWGSNVQQESYFDSMTHFDFKTLLPALLHVEDRMSMANSVESRVPLLDHPLVELVATIPSNIKFQNGELKRLLKTTFSSMLPKTILDRKDKMGFPVPLNHWLKEPKSRVREYIFDIFQSQKSKQRIYLTNGFDIDPLIGKEGKFGRNLWGLISLELWQQRFFDNHQFIGGLE